MTVFFILFYSIIVFHDTSDDMSRGEGRREKALLGTLVLGRIWRMLMAALGLIRVRGGRSKKKAKAKTSRLRWIAVRDGNVGRTPLDDPKHCTP